MFESFKKFKKFHCLISFGPKFIPKGPKSAHFVPVTKLPLEVSTVQTQVNPNPGSQSLTPDDGGQHS